MTYIAIKAENITKTFRKFHKKSSFAGLASMLFTSKKRQFSEEVVVAVDNLSFELKKGEALGIIGNNGTGKSTLLKILCGITKQTSGTVTVDGEISAFLDMGVALVPELTGSENIFIYGEFQGLSPANLKLMYPSIVKFSELDDYIDTPVKYYSTGMMMRLAFSVVAHSKKDILMFDEAFAVGDIFFRTKCQKWLDELKNRNKSIVLVSHSMNEVVNFCDHLILMDKGKIIANGNVGDVVNFYNETYLRKGNKQSEKFQDMDSTVASAKKNITDEVQWTDAEAPGDIHCKIIGAQIINSVGTTEANNEDLKLKILAAISDFTGDIGFIISDILENRVICEFALHHFKRESASFQNDKFDLVWSIPRHLLNNGVYKIGIIILNSEGSVRYRALNVLSFKIERENEPENRYVFPLRAKHDFSISEHRPSNH